jgi:hypothetical protein
MFETARTLEFHDKLEQAHKEFWNADNFRELKCDKYMTDKQHEIGMLFAKWKAHRHSESVGEMPSTRLSNHARRNDLFRWTPLFYEWLESRRTLEVTA